MDSTFTYVGAYAVTTPSGIWPASLLRADFDIRIGPANVKDVQYSLLVRGVGKIEALRVSALFVYHSRDKTAKVIAKNVEISSRIESAGQLVIHSLDICV